MRKRYHGWIFIEKSRGLKDYFSIQHEGKTRGFGHGEQAAAAAVDYFETKLGLGPVKLESTPLGLRVFTMEPDGPEPLKAAA